MASTSLRPWKSVAQTDTQGEVTTVIEGSDGADRVATLLQWTNNHCESRKRKANAALIVHCVNTYAELVEALEKAQYELLSLRFPGNGPPVLPSLTVMQEVRTAIRTATNNIDL